jgi:hypothetical protein
MVRDHARIVIRHNAHNVVARFAMNQVDLVLVVAYTLRRTFESNALTLGAFWDHARTKNQSLPVAALVASLREKTGSFCGLPPPT